ncbi:hypothetical protein [Nocardia aurea]|uniref:Secreted protein n=1 Tax=Nocardia aurea TaxID=2144174 RepID=A0ABV3FMM0_9NOCA
MKLFRTCAVASVAIALGLLGAGSGTAGTGSAGNYPPPAPTYTLLPGGIVRIEPGPGGPPTGWWCGGASLNPPTYFAAPRGAPLPQDLHFPPGSTVQIECTSGSDVRARVELVTLP